MVAGATAASAGAKLRGGARGGRGTGRDREEGPHKKKREEMEGTGAHQKHEDGDGAGRRWLGRSDGDELVLERGDRTWGRGRRWCPEQERTATEQERTATNRPAARWRGGFWQPDGVFLCSALLLR